MSTKKNFTIRSNIQTRKQVEPNISIKLFYQLKPQQYFQKYIGSIMGQPLKTTKYLLFKPIGILDASYQKYAREFDFIHKLPSEKSFLKRLKFVSNITRFLKSKQRKKQKNFLKLLSQALKHAIIYQKFFQECDINKGMKAIEDFLSNQNNILNSLQKKKQRNDFILDYEFFEELLLSIQSIETQQLCEKLLNLGTITIDDNLQKLQTFCQELKLLLLVKQNPQTLQEMEIYICQELKNNKTFEEYQTMLKEQVRIIDYKSQRVKSDIDELKTIEYQLYNQLFFFQSVNFDMVYLFDPMYIYYHKQSQKIRLGIEPFILDFMKKYQKYEDKKLMDYENLFHEHEKKINFINRFDAKKINQVLNCYFKSQSRLEYQILSIQSNLTKSKHFINLVKVTFFILSFSRDNTRLIKKILNSSQNKFQLVGKYIQSIYFIRSLENNSSILNGQHYHAKLVKSVIQNKCQKFDPCGLNAEEYLNRLTQVQPLTFRDMVDYSNGKSISFVKMLTQIQDTFKNIKGPFKTSFSIVFYFLIKMIAKILEENQQNMKQMELIKQMQKKNLVQLINMIQKQKQPLSQAGKVYYKKIEKQNSPNVSQNGQNGNNFNLFKLIIEYFNLIIEYLEKEFFSLQFIKKTLLQKKIQQIRKYHLTLLHVIFQIDQILIVFFTKSTINLDLNSSRLMQKLIQLTKMQKDVFIDKEDYHFIKAMLNKIEQRLFPQTIKKVFQQFQLQLIRFNSTIQEQIGKLVQKTIFEKNKRKAQNGIFKEGQQEQLLLLKPQFQNWLFD